MKLLNLRINFFFFTRLSIPIRGRGKSPEESQRWNLVETLWKKKQHKNNQDEDKKSAINKKLIPSVSFYVLIK